MIIIYNLKRLTDASTVILKPNIKGVWKFTLVELKSVYLQIFEKKSEKFDLELSKNRKDEPCLCIFSAREVRDDCLPLLYLHTSEFWYRSGHVCPDLPENNTEEDVEGLAIDHDIYDPTLHTRL
jgi:hypothetical protein